MCSGIMQIRWSRFCSRRRASEQNRTRRAGQPTPERGTDRRINGNPGSGGRGTASQRLYDAVAGALRVKEALQYQHGGYLIDDLAVSGAGAARGIEVAVGFGGGEALVPEVDGEGEGFTKRFGKLVGPLGLGADVAGGVEGIAEHDGDAAEPAEEAAERLEVLTKVFADEGENGLGGEAELIGDGDADASGAEIEAEKARRHT